MRQIVSMLTLTRIARLTLPVVSLWYDLAGSSTTRMLQTWSLTRSTAPRLTSLFLASPSSPHVISNLAKSSPGITETEPPTLQQPQSVLAHRLRAHLVGVFRAHAGQRGATGGCRSTRHSDKGMVSGRKTREGPTRSGSRATPSGAMGQITVVRISAVHESWTHPHRHLLSAWLWPLRRLKPIGERRDVVLATLNLNSASRPRSSNLGQSTSPSLYVAQLCLIISCLDLPSSYATSPLVSNFQMDAHQALHAIWSLSLGLVVPLHYDGWALFCRAGLQPSSHAPWIRG